MENLKTSTNNQGKMLNTAMVLAAGYSTRMEDLTRQIPKALLPVDENHTIIDAILIKLANSGIHRVVINLHYLGEKLKQYVSGGNRYGLQIFFSEEETLLGSGGAIAFAEKYFKGEDVLVINADVLTDISIPAFYQYHIRENNIATMAVLPTTLPADYRLVVFDTRNRLRGFVNGDAAVPADCSTGIFTGYHILSPEARAYLKPVRQSVMANFYFPAIEKALAVGVYRHSGTWIDLGTKSRYLEVRGRIRSGELPLSKFLK